MFVIIATTFADWAPFNFETTKSTDNDKLSSSSVSAGNLLRFFVEDSSPIQSVIIGPSSLNRITKMNVPRNLRVYGSTIFYLMFLLYFTYAPAQAQTPQMNVVTEGKRYGLFLWIYLKPGSDLGPLARAVSKVQNYANEACQTPGCSQGDEVWAGVGFGSNLYNQLTNTNNRTFTLTSRQGDLGPLPSTGGDIFIHAKSNNFGKLFELTQIVQKNLAPDALASFSDTYGFVYKEGRDLSGFIDGTENPSVAERQAVAVENSGGSYCITQEWVHKMDFISQQSATTLESFVGRSINDSSELFNKSITSHVARMTSGPEYKASKPVQMYRQSMPYGRLGDKAGLFFIGFADSTNNFDYFLNRMVGQSDNKNDDIMRLSSCISGNYWYFPSVEELNRLQNTVLNGKLYKSDQSIPNRFSNSPSLMSNSIADQQRRSSPPPSTADRTMVNVFILAVSCLLSALLRVF